MQETADSAAPVEEAEAEGEVHVPCCASHRDKNGMPAAAAAAACW